MYGSWTLALTISKPHPARCSTFPSSHHKRTCEGGSFTERQTRSRCCHFRYVFTLFKPDEGVSYLQIPPEAAFNDAGNPNVRSPEFITPVYDSVPPTVTLSSDSPFVTNKPVDVTFTFSEEVVGFSLHNVQLTLSSGEWGPLVSFNHTVYVAMDRDGGVCLPE